MASQSSIALVFFLVLVGAATLSAYPPPKIYPISYFNNEEVQFLGKFAVDQYNKKGGPYLYFIQAVNGTVFELTFVQRVWFLELTATNCTQSGTQASYLAQIYENISVPGQIQAYGSDFTNGTFTKV